MVYILACASVGRYRRRHDTHIITQLPMIHASIWRPIQVGVESTNDDDDPIRLELPLLIDSPMYDIHTHLVAFLFASVWHTKPSSLYYVECHPLISWSILMSLLLKCTNVCTNRSKWKGANWIANSLIFYSILTMRFIHFKTVGGPLFNSSVMMRG